ncbi:hypothetical protein [Paraburkholderia youngii]|uniref:hypothetical protein n=1 Tax=Paraburkholderia youngii TaxID=2782701 RepID=UPI003D21072E
MTTTPYGEVDAAALDGLQSRYDTTRVLDAVDTLDELRTGLDDPEGLRDDLLRLHGRRACTRQRRELRGNNPGRVDCRADRGRA